MVEFNKQGRDWQEVSESIHNLFAQQGYSLESGTKIDGIYGIGSAGGRVMLGGLKKRNKFSIKIFTTPDGGTLINFDKAMSGMGGGIIGVAKMNKEFKRVQDLLQAL